MKTIKIFLASSEELSPEREKMADLVLHLNKLFKGRGIELDLEKWEYLDASMSGKRKQMSTTTCCISAIFAWCCSGDDSAAIPERNWM